MADEEASKLDVETDAAASSPEDERLTRPPPPNFIEMIRHAVSAEERTKIAKQMLGADKPTALIPASDDPDAGNFSIPKLQPVSDDPPPADAGQMTVEGDIENDLIRVLLHEKENTDLCVTYLFLKQLGFDIDCIIDALGDFEHEGNLLEAEDMLAMFTILLRQGCLMLKHALNNGNVDSKHTLVQLAQKSLEAINSDHNANKRYLINRLDQMANQLMVYKTNQRQRDIFKAFKDTL